MRKIALLCIAGMSTSMLELKMVDAAKKEGYACEIRAYPLSDLKKIPADVDIVLLGPQVMYERDNVEATLGCPTYAITMAEYGAMDGAGVLKKAKEVLHD